MIAAALAGPAALALILAFRYLRLRAELAQAARRAYLRRSAAFVALGALAASTAAGLSALVALPAAPAFALALVAAAVFMRALGERG